MQNHVTSTSHNTTIPFPTAHAAADREETANAPTPDASETPAGGGAPRGRPRVYPERVIEMICGPIREFGLSDSAAAESIGVSSSTISRWKQQFPELGPKLQQARFECRMLHLRNIQRHADSDKTTSLRASMWILERVFPGDYAPRMKERFAYQQREERRQEREAEEFRREQSEERWEAHLAGKRAETEAKQEAAAEAAKSASTPESDSHHSRKSAGAPEPSPAPDSRAASVSDSHHSRKPGEARPPRDPEAAERAAAQAWHNAFEHDPRNSQKWAAAYDASLAEEMRTASEGDSHNSRKSSFGTPLPDGVGPSSPMF
jgi:hypothetical protein